jgi:hypothetical protein
VRRRKPPAPQDAWYNQRRLHSTNDYLPHVQHSWNRRQTSAHSFAVRSDSELAVASSRPSGLNATLTTSRSWLLCLSMARRWPLASSHSWTPPRANANSVRIRADVRVAR